MNHAIPKKQLGQHWLHDEDTLTAICDAASVVKEDKVLEVGPGTGELTAQLIARGAEVTALEFDQSLLPKLRKRFKSNPIDLQYGDIRTYDLTRLPSDYKIVANIPYYLSTYLFRLLCDTKNKPSVAVLLVQKEVAERAAANPGNMAFISVLLQLWYETSLDVLVPAHLFTPPPKVDSQVLVLTRREAPLFEVDYEQFARVVKAGFSERRKKLRSSLSGGLRISKEEAESLCDAAGVDANLRAQNLELNDWYRVYLEVTK